MDPRGMDLGDQSDPLIDPGQVFYQSSSVICPAAQSVDLSVFPPTAINPKSGCGRVVGVEDAA
jgi:hypothetical protein